MRLFPWILAFIAFSVTSLAGEYFDRIDVDNVRIDGNTVSTTNSNGHLVISPNGTGLLEYTPGTASTVPYLDSNKRLTSSATTATQLGYLGNATSNLCGISQACTITNKSIDADDNTITDIDNGEIKAAAGISLNKLEAVTASRVLVSDGSGFVSAASTTATTLGYLDIGSSLTTLLAAKAPTASPTFTGTVTTPLSTAGPVITSSGGVLSSEATLAISRGGTGQSTAQAAIDALVPSQSGNSGLFLKTDGTNVSWASATAGSGRLLARYYYTNSGSPHTYNKNGGASRVQVTVVGSGGGGGGSASTAAGEATVPTAGAGGEVGIKSIDNSSIGATETITVAAGGGGGSAGNNNGSAGNTSSFGSHCTAVGGSAGAGSAASNTSGGVAGSSGGTGGTGCDLFIPGGYSYNSRRDGSGGIIGWSHSGGTPFAPSVTARHNANGLACVGYGGGGGVGPNGASQSARSGGAGCQGLVIVEEYE